MRIKKQIKIIIILFLLIIPILLIRKVFIRKYDIIYEKNKYMINEKYEYKDKEHIYEINIKNKKQEITYILNNDFNKEKKIIKELKIYKENDITCFLPIYNKKVENKLYCLKDNIQVSNYYLKDNTSYKKIISKLKKYKIKNYSDNTKTVKYRKIQVYENNINEEDIFTIWDYKGINIIEKNKTSYIKFLDYDLYDDIKTIIYDNYFVLFENNHVDGIKNIHYYDFEKNKIKIYNPEIIMSKDFYINGVVDNLIYVTDNKNKKEYTINLKKEEIIQINKDNEYLTYHDNNFYSLTKSDYFMEKQLFQNKKLIDKKDIILNMNTALSSRGPDECGYYNEENILLSYSENITSNSNIYNPLKNLLKIKIGEYFHEKKLRYNKQIQQYSINNNIKNSLLLVKYLIKQLGDVELPKSKIKQFFKFFIQGNTYYQCQLSCRTKLPCFN